MIELINQNQPQFWLLCGFALLALEAAAFGFTSGVFLFTGIGALLTGTLLLVGLLPMGWTAGVIAFALLSGISAALLWQPLKRMQSKTPGERNTSSDFVGHTFELTDEITRTKPGSTNYSGIEWQVRIDEHETEVQSIAKGSRVIVTSIDVGCFHVKEAAA